LSVRTEDADQEGPASTPEALVDRADAWHRRACAAQRELFRAIALIGRTRLWEAQGARDMAHWLWMRYGLSDWKARRWIASAHALESLPRIAEAFASGDLGIDKVVELTRLATAETEGELLPWARRVAPGAIRHKADVALRRSLQEVVAAQRSRSLWWWYSEDGTRMSLEGELPAAEGAVVARAIDRLANKLPAMPGEEDPCDAPARRADALVALCSARLSDDPDPDRATVVVHASLEALVWGDGGCELEGGGVIHSATAKRLACTGRIQVMVEDGAGDPVRVGGMRRDPPTWMVRHLRYRDRECRFPGCGARRFTQAHHVVWWERGGRTELDNLVLICSFHHRLVHEYGWSLWRDEDNTVRWFRPSGVEYRAGPGPPLEAGETRSQFQQEPQPALSAAGFKPIEHHSRHRLLATP
jgi:Domain of unknown function (DUF222)/HNH endonuclease